MNVLTLNHAAALSYLRRTETDPWGNHEVPSIKLPEGLRVRYLGFGDDARAEREAWVTGTFKTVEFFAYGENNLRFLSRADSDFDMLIVGGIDAPRITRIVRAFAPFFGNRAKVALLSRSDARGRAQVLSGGFDEVIDPARISRDEALLRLSAVWSRFEGRRLERQRAESDHAALVSLVTNTSLTPYERKILALVATNDRTGVTYTEMCRTMGVPNSFDSIRTFRVIISHLRKKLKPNVQIVSIRGLGYKLIIENL